MNNFELNRYDQAVSEIPQNILNCYLTKYFSKEDQELIRSVHFDNLSTEELFTSRSIVW